MRMSPSWQHEHVQQRLFSVMLVHAALTKRTGFSLVLGPLLAHLVAGQPRFCGCER